MVYNIVYQLMGCMHRLDVYVHYILSTYHCIKWTECYCLVLAFQNIKIFLTHAHMHADKPVVADIKYISIFVLYFVYKPGSFITMVLCTASATGSTYIRSSFTFHIFALPPIV